MGSELADFGEDPVSCGIGTINCGDGSGMKE